MTDTWVDQGWNRQFHNRMPTKCEGLKKTGIADYNSRKQYKVKKNVYSQTCVYNNHQVPKICVRCWQVVVVPLEVTLWYKNWHFYHKKW